MAKTAAQAAANWVNSAGRAASEWQSGVQGYQGDWAGATTSQQATMLNNLTQAVTSGRWASGVQRAASTWKQDTIAKAANFSTGFSAGAQRQATAIAKIVAAEATIRSSLTPRGDYAANKARMNQMVDGLHSLKGQLGA